jgi:hypothetical protein
VSKGVLIFAFDSERVKYSRMARLCVDLVHRFLDVPCTVVTNTELDWAPDTVINTAAPESQFRPDSGTNERVEWKNFNRYTVYDYSPYDETILLDADYLVMDTQLKTIWDQDFDYLIPNNNLVLQHMDHVEYLGPKSFPTLWATVVPFRKTTATEVFFNMVGRVQRNYDYYSKLYHCNTGMFRNDHAFTIANSILNGYQRSHNFSHYPIFTTGGNVKSVEVSAERIVCRYEERAYTMPLQSLHMMNKHLLQDSDWQQHVREATGA